MKLNNLLLLTLTALASQGIQAMNRTAIDTKAAAQRAEQFAQGMTTGEPALATVTAAPIVPAQSNTEQKETAADTAQKQVDKKVDIARLQAALPEELQHHVGSFFAREAWRHKFYDNATSYTIKTGPENGRREQFCAHAGTFMTATEIHTPETIIGFSSILQFWDITTAQSIKTVTLPGVIRATALSSRFMVACDPDNSLIIYERDTEKSHAINLVNLENGTNRSIKKIAISVHEQYIVLGTDDSRILTFQRQHDGSWKLLYHRTHGTDRYRHGVYDIVFDKSDSHIISLSGDNTIKMWDLATGTLKKILTTPETLNPIFGDQMHGVLNNCVIANDDRTIAAARAAWERPIIWDVESGEHLKLENRHKYSQSSCGGAWHVSLDAVTQHIISHHNDGEQRIWDTSGNLLKITPANKAEYAVSVGESCCSSLDKNNQYIISDGKGATCIAVRMCVGSADKLLKELSLEQLLLIDDLIRAREKVVQKDAGKPLVLSPEQLEALRQLPPFVQTALRINLTLQIADLSLTDRQDKGDQKNS